MARMIVVYRTPKDVEAFDRHGFDGLPGRGRCEVGDGAVGLEP